MHGARPLLFVEAGAFPTIVPGALFLNDPGSIEDFLISVDGAPPNWSLVYGPIGSNHDERLFALNRERDGMRLAATEKLLTFVWPGELSEYDPHAGGFRVAVGPKVVSTQWGLVRFKPDGLPSNLVAVPTPSLKKTLLEREKGPERVEIEVAMTGRLVPEESIIYDFSHEEPGVGMVMPVVRIERVDYVMLR
ncbi:MAG TPA: hypothetical protein VJ692_06870 [Nitrospiraceae bacterium]|nr:hypothetical protein [Nitrospiraceae bacterium]